VEFTYGCIMCYQTEADASSSSAAAAGDLAPPGVLPQTETRTSQKVAGFLTTGKLRELFAVCRFWFIYFSGLRRWLGGLVVRALESGPRGREFDSQPVRCQVTTLGKLFTPYTCLCRCTWSSGWC